MPGFGLPPVTPRVLPIGRGEVLREGHDLLFVGFGPIVMRAIEAADALAAEGWSIGVINARFAKPLDGQLILDGARGKRLVVTFEESVVAGGFGSGVLELVEEARPTDVALRDVLVKVVGIPGDRFVDHGSGQGPPARAPPRRRRARRAGPRDARRARGGPGRVPRSCRRLSSGRTPARPAPSGGASTHRWAVWCGA